MRPIYALIAVVAFAVHAWAATVTIEPIVKSIGSERDPVPGRDWPIVFRGQQDVQAPAMNQAGEIVFRAFSASEFDPNFDTAIGIYVQRPGEPLTVLADSTLIATTTDPTFEVPGRSSSSRFTHFAAPLINNAGDVLFQARFSDPVSGSGSGIYATTTTGGPLVKVVDSFDPVPGVAGATFSSFTFSSVTLDDLTLAVLDDSGAVAFYGRFDGVSSHGLYGSSVSGASPFVLADSTDTIIPTGVPTGTPGGFTEVRPQFALNNAGIVAFHGSIRVGTGSARRQGLFSVPVAGGIPDTVAFQFDAAPEGGTATFQIFSNQTIDASGEIVFLAGLSDGKAGIYKAVPSASGPATVTRVVATSSGIAVPNNIAGAEFDALFFPAVNDSGQASFVARISNSPGNAQGIYFAALAPNTLDFVIDAAATAPGLPAPAALTNFVGPDGLVSAINENGHVAFEATGADSDGLSLRGVYFYDACADGTERIVDSTTSLEELGGTFSTAGTQTRKFDLYQGGQVRSSHYRSINDNNEVAFLAQFSNFDFGIYMATVSVAGGGSINIICPGDVTVDCAADTSPASTGEPIAEGCGTLNVTFGDTATADCGGAGTITRTWTVDDGAGGTDSCDQVITLEDTTEPQLTLPADVTIECDADSTPAATGTASATDDCDAAPAIGFSDSTAAGSCLNESIITRTWTAADACGNSTSAAQTVTLVDTTAPLVSCPEDALELECPADTSTTARGSATATDSCGDATVTSNDTSVAGCGETETITRTWTGADECGNADSCEQTIETVDTTPPTVTVDSTPIMVVDIDCTGDEPVNLPVASTIDDCGAATVVDDAPSAFPAGQTSTVTYTATDECGNEAAEQLDVTVEYGADIKVKARKFVIGFGYRPFVTKVPLAGITVAAFDNSAGSCAEDQLSQHFGVLWWALPDILANCTPVTTAVTDENGFAFLNVPPGDYIVASHFDSDDDGVLDQYLGRRTSNLVCGELEIERLFMIELASGRRFGATFRRLTGSELLIIEPEEVVWDETEQLYPFVFDSEGDWDVTVGIEPPEGFVSDFDELSENVADEVEGLQFTVTEVGSDLVPTLTTFRVTHNGRSYVVRSEIGIRLTPDYARSRGFNVAELRSRGLILDANSKTKLEQTRLKGSGVFIDVSGP